MTKSQLIINQCKTFFSCWYAWHCSPLLSPSTGRIHLFVQQLFRVHFLSFPNCLLCYHELCPFLPQLLMTAHIPPAICHNQILLVSSHISLIFSIHRSCYTFGKSSHTEVFFYSLALELDFFKVIKERDLAGNKQEGWWWFSTLLRQNLNQCPGSFPTRAF